MRDHTEAKFWFYFSYHPDEVMFSLMNITESQIFLAVTDLFCYCNVVQSTLQYTGSTTLLDMFHLAFSVHQ